ncbi:hypothetical protein CALCODRAFT_550552 [Calocera cornea HHB12733]|uniref:GST N-terminal domain-containing protein n=1 Tax=Calocera cornea HHB12733 TaxID=1353952 RepID=A0A165FQK3_9BASI|nr:hypothetical protein CALCODRAFT_550552 [Calocera cornea HHB12733]
MSTEAKPTLYVFGPAVWPKVPEIALVELGYPADAVEKKSVNLAAAENLSPEFVKISKPATLPVLVVEGNTYPSTIDVNNGKHQALIDALHADVIDPNFPFVGPRSGDFICNRYQAVVGYHETADEEMKAYLATKLPKLGYLNSLYTEALADKVQEFVNTSIAHMQRVDGFILHTLPMYLPESGFVEGAIPGEADFHLAAWIARISLLSGAPTTAKIPEALEKELGQKLPEKVASYLAAWAERAGWKAVYADGLH